MKRDQRYWDELDQILGYPRDTDEFGNYPGQTRYMADRT